MSGLSPNTFAELEQLEIDAGSEVNPNVQDWEFEEDAVVLPDYPDFDKLLKVNIDASFGQFKYAVDPASISIGRDGVVALTMVITSSRGGKNVLFEAYRCDTREYKTIAYGTSSKSFYATYDPQWKMIYRTSGNAQDYRREMVTTYLCNIHREAMPKEEIIRPSSSLNVGYFI